MKFVGPLKYVSMIYANHNWTLKLASFINQDGMEYQAESKERKISDGTEEIPVYRTTPEKVAIHVAKTGQLTDS